MSKPITNLRKKAKLGEQGFPRATLAFYGPDDKTATKAVLGIFLREGDEGTIHRYFSDEKSPTRYQSQRPWLIVTLGKMSSDSNRALLYIVSPSACHSVHAPFLRVFAGRLTISEARAQDRLSRGLFQRNVWPMSRPNLNPASPSPMDTPEERRRRIRSAALAVATMIVGLVVHRTALGLNPLVRDVAGDALWAMMIFFGLGVLLPRAWLRTRTAWALAICFGVEASQLYHSPRLDALRATLPGHLILGSGFDPRDFLSYSLGVAAAVLLERAGVSR